MESRSVLKYAALLVVFSLATLGCMTPTDTEETKLYDFEGLGVLSFGLPVIPGTSPAGTVQIVPPSGDAYMALLVRNNAEGDYASNIVVRLENVEPFQIRECHKPYEPNWIRTTNCPPYSEDVGLLYSEHRESEMYPDQEIEFFWTLIAPDASQIADMFYDHIIYYSVEYDYKVSASQTILAMTQAEKNSRLSEGKAVTGSMSTSHGEVKFVPSFSEPIIYNTGQTEGQDKVLKYTISNSNSKGTVKPGTKINVTVTLPGAQGSNEYAQVPSDAFLLSYEWYRLNTDPQMKSWFEEEFLSDVQQSQWPGITDRTIYMQIDAEFIRETGSDYTFYVPVRLKEQIVPTSLSLPFYLRVSYRYILDCKTATDCAQLRVEPLG